MRGLKGFSDMVNLNKLRFIFQLSQCYTFAVISLMVQFTLEKRIFQATGRVVECNNTLKGYSYQITKRSFCRSNLY